MAQALSDAADATTNTDKTNTSAPATASAEAKIETASKMQAVQLVEYNQDLTKSMTINSIAVPTISDDEILVQVSYASINPGDWRIASGVAQKVQSFELPRTMGSDFGGNVIQIGNNIDKSSFKNGTLEVGSSIVGVLGWQGTGTGCMSEFVAIKPENFIILPKSANITLANAAGAGIAGITSYKALIETGKVETLKNWKILILGGSTACGLFGIQFAKAFGASEIHVTSSKVDLCSELGATKVYSYKEVEKDASNKWWEVLKNGAFDIIYDCVATGGEHFKLCTENKILDGKSGKFISLCGDLPEKMGVLGYGTMASMAMSQVCFTFLFFFCFY